MSSLPTFHDQTTILDPSGSGTGTTSTTAPTNTTTITGHSHTQDLTSKAHTSNTSDYSNTNTNTSDYTTSNSNTTARTNPDTISSTTEPPHERLNSVYEPTTEIQQPRGSLSSTTGPFQVPTTDDVSKKDAPLTSSVGQQSAPGRAGSIGDKALSAMGYGGSKVERPKEDQGLGEKIVNFLGA